MVETIDAGAHRYVGAAFTVVDSGAIRVHRERCAKVRNRNVDCLKCAAACTSGCLSLDDGELVIDASKCVGCGTCATVCPTCALESLNPSDAELKVACLRAAFFEENAVGHRDMLGALMGCGIRREAVGDLCLQPRQCDLFVTAELAPYLLDNLTSAGRAHLTLTRIAPSQADRPPQALQELRVTVSSPRLDSVISAAFHLSRGSAADAVAAGRVNLNDLPCLKPDRAVQENDTVSVRGLGKLRVLALGGLTKKGRLALTLGKYL